MANDIPKKSQLVQIELYDKYKKKIVVKILDVTSESILMDFNVDIGYSPQEGDNIVIYFPSDDGLKKMTTTVNDYDVEKSLISAKISDNIEKIERRSYFRVEINVPLQYTILNRRVAKPTKKHYTKNLSGGGIAFLDFFKEVKLNDILKLEIILPNMDGEPVNVEGKVVRLTPDIMGFTEIGVMFINITEDQRNKIILYLSTLQKDWI